MQPGVEILSCGSAPTTFRRDRQRGERAAEAEPDERVGGRWHAWTNLGMIGVILTILIVPLVVLGLQATTRGPQTDVAQEEGFLRIRLGLGIARVSQDQRALVVAPDAQPRVAAGDIEWMHETFGRRAHQRHQHDRGYVLRPDGRVVYAMVDGLRVEPDGDDRALDAVAPLVAQLRQALSGAELRGEALVRDVLTIDGEPSVVSLRAILPPQGALDVPRGAEHIHVAVRHIDHAFLSALAAEAGLANLALARQPPQPGEGRVLVTNERGEPVAALAWARDTSGMDATIGAMSSVLVVALGGGGLVIYLCLLLLAAARQLRAEERRARAMSRLDTLTGLPNRQHFLERLEAILQDAPEDGAPIVAFALDLDGFKEINDAFGPQVGDALVRAVAARLRDSAAECDMVARIGGDEFGLLWRSCGGMAAIEALARRILADLCQPFRIADRTITIAGSLGIAMTGDGDRECDRPTEIIRRADIALYQAKGAGKGRHCLFQPGFDTAMRERRAIEHHLRAALERDIGLWLALQPIHDISGTRTVGAEALVRWDHPTLGPLSPARFVPVAEECNLTHILGTWVLRQACAAARALDLPWVAVNVSAAHIRVPGFVDLVFDTLRSTGLSPERLQLEITEGLILDGSDAVASVILKLRFAGIKIALDDFGTGYSSLGYLTRHKIDKIKIDRSFIGRLGGDPTAAPVVRALLDLASALDLDVTVEGVETRQQWEALRRLGRPELQGFLFSRPLRPEELAEQLAEPLPVPERREYRG